MKLSDFDYDLPLDFIAQKPVSPKDSSKLMILNSKIEHKRFYDITDYLQKGDVLVVNETKVNKAKIIGRKQSGSPAEVIIEKFKGKKAYCIIKTRHPHKGVILFFGKYQCTVLDQEKDLFNVEFNEDVEKIMGDIGILPTPPYIQRKLDKDSQYQTIYSKKKGSIAAPTAGLHFTNRLLSKIKKKGIKIAKVTLHVGSGTFFQVKDVDNHKMHSEYFEINKKNALIINNRKGKLIVVGTTCVRALESVADKKGKISAKKGETDIFIKPGYRFKNKIDMLITNFHLPKSTLLMLVSAFIGRKKILDAYKTAVKKKYRFFSFGDAMLLFRE